MSATLFNGGVPTDGDVKRLREAIGTPSLNQMIAYDEISKALGIARTANRWKTIVGQWRKQMDRELGVVLRAERNTGYRVLDAKGLVSEGSRRHRQGLRRVMQGAVIAQRADPEDLTPAEQRTRDHLGRVAAAVQGAIAVEATKLKLPPPIKLPKAG